MKGFAPLLIVGLAIGCLRGSILTEARHAETERLLKLVKKDVIEKIKALITAKAVKAPVDYNEESCPADGAVDKAKPVQVCVKSFAEATSTIVMEFRAPHVRFELELSNIDLNEPNSDISIDAYVNDFADSVAQLALDPAEFKKNVEDGVKEAGTEAGAADIAIAGDKITYTYKGRANTVVMAIKDQDVTFTTDYFQSSLGSPLAVASFVKGQTKVFFKELISHLGLMQAFALSDGDSAAQSIKTLTCEKLVGNADVTAAITERFTKSGLTYKAEGTTASIEKDGKAINVKCEVVAAADFNVLQLTVDFAAVAPTIKNYSQAILEKSLYNLVPVFHAFMLELAVTGERLLADKIPDEAAGFEVAGGAQTGGGDGAGR